MTLLWRFIAWYLGRTLTPEQLTATLGDLAEDFAAVADVRGRVRATWWLLREAHSVSAAYRARAAQARRASRRTIMSGSWMGDLRFAARRLRRHPAAAIASAVTLASAIAAGTVTWSLLSALLLAPLPVDDPDTLMVIGARGQRPDGEWTPTRYAHRYGFYPALRDSGVFDRVAAGGRMSLLVTTPAEGAVPQSRTVYFVTHDFFDTLGVALARGTGFREVDDRAGAPLAAIVSHRYWQSALAADPDVLGRVLRISDGHATIVGVAPPRFRGLSLADAPDVYLPLHTAADIDTMSAMQNPLDDGTTTPTAWLTLVGRLGASTAAATAARLNALPPDVRLGATLELVPVNTAAIPEPAREPMAQFATLLAVTVGLLVLIGCVTVGMLLLVRTESRRSELAMCLALGGTRRNLAWGVVFEGGLLTLAGCALAVPTTQVIFAALGAFQLPGGVRIELLELSFGPAGWMAMAVVGIAMLVALVLVAGLFGSSATVTDVLHARSGSTPVTMRRHTRTVLVAAQVAVALVLLAGAGLFSRSLTAALTLNTGFDASRIVTGQMSLRPHGYTADRADGFFESLRTRIEGEPSIAAVSIVRWQGGMTTAGQIVVNGTPRQFPSFVAYTAVDDHYFPTMGMSILEGRNFAPSDTPATPLVVIVSESLARALAGSGRAIGVSIMETSWTPGQPPAVAEVIGVVPDVITNVADTAPLVKYYAMAQQRSLPHATVVARARGDSSAAKRAVLSAVRQLDPQVDPTPLLTIEEQLAQQMGPQQLGRFVLGSLGTVAFLLTLLGAYVLAETMSSGRRREFGIRAALGASRAALAGAVLGETARLVGIGLLAGLALAWMGANMIRALLFRIEPLDPLTLLTASGAILALALVVSLAPARDAARVDLVRTLHEE